jgi:hypothetical protein
MRLYRLSRLDFEYDEHDGAAVLAESEDHARRQVADELIVYTGSPDERWLSPEFAECEEVSLTEYGLVLTSFHHG